MGLQQSGPSSQNLERMTACNLDTIVYYIRDSSRSMDPETGPLEDACPFAQQMGKPATRCR